MKKILFSLLLCSCCATIVFADTRPFMRLANGKVLRDVKLSKVNHRGLCFVHRGGFETVKPKELSAEDQKLYAKEIKKFNGDVKKEQIRVRNARKLRQDRLRKERAAIAAKRKALQNMFNEELEVVREKGVEHFYSECLRLERRWRGKSINRSELNKMKAEGWQQKLTAPVITNKNMVAYAILLDKLILRYRYAVANNTKLISAHNRLVEEWNKCFGKLTADEKIVVLWQRSRLNEFYEDALQNMEVSEKSDTNNVGKELRKILDAEKKIYDNIIYRFSFKMKDIEQMSPDSEDVNEVIGSLQAALVCTACKGRGFVELSENAGGGNQDAAADEANSENAENDENADGEEGAKKAKKAKKRSPKVAGTVKIDFKYSDKTKEMKAEPCMTCRSIGAILPKDEN